jgi:hypothetical protein
MADVLQVLSLADQLDMLVTRGLTANEQRIQPTT